ncbi:CRTAC1 family protein [Winogradskya humida]|uniref:RNA-binding protein n=1 Tax=Winogradskya humida TaxID=113566 RepID=A0ABQ4A2L6_9ACTN|nr:CRTAC1 family protein [Actinoplanes humidus]GIE24592.1 RNA-binding protein [Actinoplanes humidus]
MAWTRNLLRRQAAGAIALLLILGMYLVAYTPQASAADRRDAAQRYHFDPLSIALPGGYPQQTIRKVNGKYAGISAWISSVGAAIAMNDIDGDGLANDLCVTDVRTDRVFITPVPGFKESRYPAFALDPGRLPMNPAVAPMGCVPGDYNEDGRMDLLVYWWGRTPVLFLARSGATTTGPGAYQPTEVVTPRTAPDGTYAGAKWNTNSVSVADFDGDGHEDIYIGNYFPDSPVLDDTLDGGVAMNLSMSDAHNGGADHILLHKGAAGSTAYADQGAVMPTRLSRGWTLASTATDLDGDLLPELYIANDFGPDGLLVNRSTPGHVVFTPVSGDDSRAVTPKSKRLGHDSFKGMGVDVADLDADGLYDLYVGNITTSFGIQESNFAFINTAADNAELRRKLRGGAAPFHDRSSELNLAWSGWSWDVKVADFTNSGVPDIVQTAGFVKGTVNRWAQLQELATANDTLLSNPTFWPHVQPGDDIAGGQHLLFHARMPDGRYADLSPGLGLDIPVPTRGIAIGDADGDGRLDMAVARQWDTPVFYHNSSPGTGAFLGLRLRHDATAGATGSPAVGAEVTVTTPDGRKLLGRVDGGSGHSGKRSFDVVVGLGQVTAPVTADLAWRDRDGTAHSQKLTLTPGWHDLSLGTQAREEHS